MYPKKRQLVLVFTCFLILGIMPALSLAQNTSTSTPTPASPAAESTANPEAPTCTVSTDQAKKVAVRVGPGLNRTSLLFLPVGKDFVVLGQATAKDGSEWWKLNKDEVAPKKSAKEVWIAQDDVETKGDCSTVGDSAAPPIIPITSAATPAPGATASSDKAGAPAQSTSGYTGSWHVGMLIVCSSPPCELHPQAGDSTASSLLKPYAGAWIVGGPIKVGDNYWWIVDPLPGGLGYEGWINETKIAPA
jgi:hypothetical protein